MKVIKKFIISVIFTGILLGYWKLVYIQYINPDIGYILLSSDVIPLGICEEIVYRWAPFMMASCIYVWAAKKVNPKLLSVILTGLILFIILSQLIFSVVHIPLDPIDREMLYGLPPRPTCEELCDSFLSHGVLGIILSVIYYIWIPKQKPLKALQVTSLIACFIVHITYNFFIIHNILNNNL